MKTALYMLLVDNLDAETWKSKLRLEIHCFSSTVYLYASNDPVIEASSGLKFAPYDLAYPKLKEHAEAAGLDVNVNRWELVFDFS